jgi:hypothetical protein
MPRRDVSLTVSMIVALLAHAGVVWLGIDAARQEGEWRLLGFARPPLRGGEVPGPELGAMQMYRAAVEAGDVERDRREVPRVEEPKAELPQPRPPRLEVPEMRPRVGDAAGGGDAPLRAEGEKPQEAAKQGQEQPFFGLRPRGGAPPGGGGGGGGGGGWGATRATIAAEATGARAATGALATTGALAAAVGRGKAGGRTTGPEAGVGGQGGQGGCR